MYRLTQAKFLWLLLLFSREEPRLQQAPSPRGAQLTASAAALTNACPREAALLASQTSKSYFAHGVIAENLENQEGGRIRSPPWHSTATRISRDSQAQPKLPTLPVLPHPLCSSCAVQKVARELLDSLSTTWFLLVG